MYRLEMWWCLLGCAVLLRLTSGKEGYQAQPHWWRSGVIYQVYPRSFQDSTGDGNGDLKGILSRVDHFKEIGVDALWLSPIYKSPWKDMGYDVSSFTDVDPRYGTMEDLMNLTKALHDRDIKLLLDFVPNHSSDQHPWFNASIHKLNNKADYYVWKDPSGFVDSKQQPPNNWISNFNVPAWTYNEDRKQFYLHMFGAYQPDLNYRNPALLKEIQRTLRFWLNQGIDGFRMDAVPYLVEDAEYRDAEWVDGCQDHTKAYCQIQDRLQNLEETYTILKGLNDIFQKEYNSTKVMFLEAYASPEQVSLYYQSVSVPFNFLLITDVHRDTNATQLKTVVDNYLQNLSEGHLTNWVNGNHDQSRVGTRMGKELIDAANMLNLLLPGTSIIYQGEEIGMVDEYISERQRVDTEGRDPERTPMQWDTSVNAGFSEGNKTWLPVNSNYWQVNVKTEAADKRSHLSVFKSLVNLKKKLGDVVKVETVTFNDWVFAFKRENSVYVIINLNNAEESVVLSDKFEGLPASLKVVIPSANAGYNPNEEVKVSSSISLRPRSGIVLSSGSGGAGQAAVSALLLAAAALLSISKNFFN